MFQDTRTFTLRRLAGFRSLLAAAALGAMLLVPSVTEAAPIAVGSGSNTAELTFNWYDGSLEQVVVYDVSFGDGSIDGFDLSQIAGNNDADLSLTWSNFGTETDPNYFLDIASYDTGSGTVTGDGATFDSETAPENFWHQWVDLDGSGDWSLGSGASATTITDGDRQGWVFGSDSEPTSVPEPASVALIGLGAAAMFTRRRRA